MSNVPTVIRHSDLLVAIAPLLDLLNVSANEVYSQPPLSIGDYVTFTAADSVLPRITNAAMVERVVVGDAPNSESAITVSVPVDIHMPVTVNR